MVLRENLDFKKVTLDSFKTFKCLCELCDCGCFERSKQTHASDCSRGQTSKAKLTSYSAVNASKKKCALSHYKDTFRFDGTARPATTYIPPQESYFDVQKGSQIDFNTVQKLEFKPPGIQPRLQPFEFKDNHEFSKEAVSGISSYIADFKVSGNPNFPNRIKKDPNQVTMRLPVGAFSGKSTTNEHFQDWDHKLRSKAFVDPPSLAGQHLFPTNERFFETSTRQVHDTKKIPKKFEIKEARGTLTNEGKMEFTTSNRENFVNYPGFEPPQPIIPITNKNETHVFKTKLTPSITQNQKDFVFHSNHRPPKPADCNPYLSKIENDMYPSNMFDHKTTQRIQFPGIDVRKVGLTKSCKAPDEVYVAPKEKVQGETVSMRDFKPIDVTTIPLLKAVKRPGTLRVQAGPMETQSMSSVQFLPYDVKPHVMAKDLHPDYYCPPMTKFESSTTTGETFQGKKVPRRLPFQPDASSMDIKSGSYDFNTSYDKDFPNHGLSMCESKAYLIAKSLHDEKLKQQQGVHA